MARRNPPTSRPRPSITGLPSLHTGRCSLGVVAHMRADLPSNGYPAGRRWLDRPIARLKSVEQYMEAQGSGICECEQYHNDAKFILGGDISNEENRYEIVLQLDTCLLRPHFSVVNGLQWVLSMGTPRFNNKDEKKDYLQLVEDAIEDEMPGLNDEHDASTPSPLTPVVSPCLQVRVHVNATKKTSVKDVFQGLAVQSGVGLAIDPSIDSSIIYTARNQPLIEVARTIAHVSNLRVEFDQCVLRVTPNYPYLKNYDVKFLSMMRESSSRSASNVGIHDPQLEKKDKTEKTDGILNSSSNVLTVEGHNDFWTDLEGNLTRILNIKNDTLSSGSPPVSSEGKHERDTSSTEPFSINRQAGVVTVYGTQEQHSIVTEFIEKLKKSISSQILIEAKVVEVTLDDAYKNGINWSALIGHEGQDKLKLVRAGNNQWIDDLSLNNLNNNVFSGSLSTKNVTAALNLLESFGSVRTLSSPRLTVLNNQMAILKVVRNQVYFHMTFANTTPAGSSGGGGGSASGNGNGYFFGNSSFATQVATSTMDTVPIGLIMNVQAAIDPDTQEIILNLRPSITRIDSMVNDPAIDFMIQMANASNNASIPFTVKSSVPVVAVQEMDSVLRMKSGQITVLGGLMTENSQNDELACLGWKIRPLNF